MTYRDYLPSRLCSFYDAGDRACVRACVLGEAESEGERGMLAVGWSLIWRHIYAQLRLYTFCFSPVDLRENALARLQYDCFWGDGFLKRAATMTHSLEHPELYPIADNVAATIVAADAAQDYSGDITGGADFYFNPNLALPSWAADFTLTRKIGKHLFYTSQI